MEKREIEHKLKMEKVQPIAILSRSYIRDRVCPVCNGLCGSSNDVWRNNKSGRKRYYCSEYCARKSANKRLSEKDIRFTDSEWERFRIKFFQRVVCSKNRT